MFVSLHWYLVVDTLMAATVVVILDVVPNALSQARHVVLRVDIDILRLDGTPEALYPDVVLAAAAAIHADPDAESLTGGQPQVARILAALVGVDNLRSTMGFHSQLEHLDAVLLVKRVVQSPGHDTAAVHVYYRREVHEPVKHRYIGDVNAPDLVGACDVKTTQQVGHPVLWLAKLGQALPRVYGGDAHLAHQPADTLRADEKAQQRQVVHHAFHPLGGMLRVLPVYLPHHLEVLCRLALGLVIVCTLADAEKFQLGGHTQLVTWGH